MFLQAGTLYVYSIHAKFCMNVVTEPAGIGSAILIRALEPWEGVARMREHRPLGKRNQLCSGPARLCQALAIDRTLDGVDLLDSNEVWLEPAPQPVNCRAWQITATGRIGISSGQHHMYRWFIDGHLSVSGLARDHVQKRELLFQPEA